MKVKTMTIYEGAICHIEDYPNFHRSGSIRGMKEKIYGKNALLVRCGNYIYNVPRSIYSRAH